MKINELMLCCFRMSFKLCCSSFQNVTKNDAAEYKVVAKNAHGEGNATITVNMDEPPK